MPILINGNTAGYITPVKFFKDLMDIDPFSVFYQVKYYDEDDQGFNVIGYIFFQDPSNLDYDVGPPGELTSRKVGSFIDMLIKNSFFDIGQILN